MRFRVAVRWFISMSCCTLVSCTLIGCSMHDDAPASEPKSKTENRDANNSNKQHTNQLASETSPYLLMHAHNPVNWQPWGEPALARAKKENKPIFLSIGYSSCHWCHVMERESFLDEEIAAYLNEHFICIKVDREERPDIDSIYMMSLNVYNQLARTGRGGGWPLSMFLTPDAKPFFGGTYFPARDGDRGARTGFLSIVRTINEHWTKNAPSIERDAETISKLTKNQLEGSHSVALTPLDAKLIDNTLAGLDDQYDEKYGGFGYDPRNPRRPKFPEPSNLFFLVDHVQKTKNARALELLVGTLERMAMGGIRDHLGGGFHRYSVDRFWQIPHFEKMLYDNGQLATVYTEAYLLTKRDDLKRVVVELLDFVLREMTHEEGGFYSALDAESEHEEGKFYRWEKREVKELLDKEQFKLFASIYGLNGSPNFEEHFYAPQFEVPLRDVAAKRGISEPELDQRLDPIRKKLLAARSQRPRPLTDTKILTSWNGLMIRGFADAARGLSEPRFATAAEDAANFVLSKLRDKDGRLLRTYGQDQAKLNAYLNDYAFSVDGLIALYRATKDKKWLSTADEITMKQIELFWDDARGGFFFTSNDHETLLARAKNPVDGAQPSGNSVSAQNLLFLAKELNKPDYLEKAEKTIRSTQVLLQRTPTTAPRMVIAVADFLATQGEAKTSKE